MVRVISEEDVVLEGEQATMDLSVLTIMSVEPALSKRSKLLLEHTLEEVFECDMPFEHDVT